MSIFENVSGSQTGSGHGGGGGGGGGNGGALFSPRQQAKKKRKSRTAFTNHQIFELEKRFLYQKYLSPADRDEVNDGFDCVYQSGISLQSFIFSDRLPSRWD